MRVDPSTRGRYQSAGPPGRAHHSQSHGRSARRSRHLGRCTISTDPPPTGRTASNRKMARPPLHSDLKNQGFFFLSFVHGVQWPDLSPSKGEQGESQEASKQLIHPIHHPANPAPATPCHLIPPLCLCQVATPSKHSTHFPPVSFGGDRGSDRATSRALVHAGAAAVRSVDRVSKRESQRGGSHGGVGG